MKKSLLNDSPCRYIGFVGGSLLELDLRDENPSDLLPYFGDNWLQSEYPKTVSDQMSDSGSFLLPES
jgi:hypothetical protein